MCNKWWRCAEISEENQFPIKDLKERK